MIYLLHESWLSGNLCCVFTMSLVLCFEWSESCYFSKPAPKWGLSFCFRASSNIDIIWDMPEVDIIDKLTAYISISYFLIWINKISIGLSFTEDFYYFFLISFCRWAIILTQRLLMDMGLPDASIYFPKQCPIRLIWICV